MIRRFRTELALVATLALATAWIPATAVGQVTLTELGAANAARNDMMANGGKPPPVVAAAPVAPAAASSGSGSNGMKYTLSYALVGMLIGLGLYLVCRPAHRNPVD